MGGAKACRKSPVLPRMVQVVTGISPARFVPYPPVIFGVNVRRFRMSGPVPFEMASLRLCVLRLLTSRLRRAPATFLSRGFSGRGRPVSRNMAASKFRSSLRTASALLLLSLLGLLGLLGLLLALFLPSAAALLRDEASRGQQEAKDKGFHQLTFPATCNPKVNSKAGSGVFRYWATLLDGRNARTVTL